MVSQSSLFEDSKPVRVTVPVPPEVHEAFKRLAAASGVSVGRAMGEWLTDTLDGVEAMTELVQRARSAPKLAVRELHGYAMGLTDLTSDLIELVRGKDYSSREAGAEAGGGLAATSAASAGSGGRAPFPPLTNRGGKVPQKPNKGPKKPGKH
jgi:hypothetical protein